MGMATCWENRAATPEEDFCIAKAWPTKKNTHQVPFEFSFGVNDLEKAALPGAPKRKRAQSESCRDCG